MEIETERLRLLPLTPHQLAVFASGASQLEELLGVSYQDEKVEGAFQAILPGQAEKVQQDKARYLWHTFWLLVRKQDNVVVGTADFKSPPNEHGNVEIGYGLGAAHRHCGYMTEAVRAMCGWVKRQKNVVHICAQTLRDNLASQRVLQRCSFLPSDGADVLCWQM